ncbi:unnamed protein product [Arabidopsis halleri]
MDQQRRKRKQNEIYTFPFLFSHSKPNRREEKVRNRDHLRRKLRQIGESCERIKEKLEAWWREIKRI